MTDQRQPPETLSINCDTMGGHGAHWQSLSLDPQQDVPRWLQAAIDDAIVPRGLHPEAETLPTSHWLLQGPTDPQLRLSQILDVNETQQPIRMRNAYPSIDSRHWREVKINRILSCEERCEAVLSLETADGVNIHAFDVLYAINHSLYDRNTTYQASLGGLAYSIEKVGENEQLTVDDPAAIRHHRALNAILAANDGVAPDDLQAQLAQWQPTSPHDQEPVILDLSKMAAYLFGEHFGQEDEAWIQGEVIGKQSEYFFDVPITVLDVVILREENTQPLVISLACSAHALNGINIEVGQFIRGNIWMQAAIHAKTMK